MEDLLKRAVKGDKTAFSSIVLEYQHQLYKIAAARLDNENDIYDATQNALISAYRNIKKVKEISFFKTWIIKILINECNLIYRKRHKRIISFEETEIDKYISLNDAYKEVESSFDFHLLLKPLNPEESMAITLFYCSDLSIKEISRLTKTNENTVKARLRNAKIKIRNNIKEMEALKDG